nr:hypothetical protein Iba_chr02bCG4810 [Ipomoea batatas]
MASGKGTAAASSSMGEGTYGSQQVAEGVTVAAPPSSPLPVPQTAPVEDRDEDKDSSPPPMENVPDAVEGDAPPLPLEPVAVGEIQRRGAPKYAPGGRSSTEEIKGHAGEAQGQLRGQEVCGSLKGAGGSYPRIPTLQGIQAVEGPIYIAGKIGMGPFSSKFSTAPVLLPPDSSQSLSPCSPFPAYTYWGNPFLWGAAG